MSATNPTHAPMGSPRAAAPRKQTYHHLVRSAVLGNLLFRFVFMPIMLSIMLFASPVSASPVSLTVSDLVATVNATTHHFIARFLGFRNIQGNSSDASDASSAVPTTGHLVSTFSAPSATTIMPAAPSPTVTFEGIRTSNWSTSISAWIRAANLSALSDSELESAIVRLVAINSTTSGKSNMSTLLPVRVNQCSLVARPHVFVFPLCRPLTNPPKSCPRTVVPPPAHGFVFPVCRAQDAPVLVAAQEMLLAQHHVASCLAGSLAFIFLVIVGTAVIARGKIAKHTKHAEVIQKSKNVAIAGAKAKVKSANRLARRKFVVLQTSCARLNRSSTSLRNDLDCALTQRDMAQVERQGMIDKHDAADAAHNTIFAQRDAAISQCATAVSERDAVMAKLKAVTKQLAAAAADRDAALSARDTAAAERDTAANRLAAAQTVNQMLRAVLVKAKAIVKLALLVARGATLMKRRAGVAMDVVVRTATVARVDAKAALESQRNSRVAAEVLLTLVRVAHDEKMATEAELKQAQVELGATLDQLTSSQAKLATSESRIAAVEAAAARADTSASQTALQLAEATRALLSAQRTTDAQSATILDLHQTLKVSPGYCSFCRDFKCKAKHANEPAHVRERLWNGAKAFASLIEHAHTVGVRTDQLPIRRNSPCHSQPQAENHRHHRQQQPRNHQQYQQHHGHHQRHHGYPQQHHGNQQQRHGNQHHHGYQQQVPVLMPFAYPGLHQQHQAGFFPLPSQLPAHLPLPLCPVQQQQSAPPTNDHPRVRFPEPRPDSDSAMDLVNDNP